MRALLCLIAFLALVWALALLLRADPREVAAALMDTAREGAAA